VCKNNCEFCMESVLIYYNYNHFTALWILSGTTRVDRHQKGETRTNLDFLEQETVSGNGISWAICKSAPRLRQITMPAPHHSVFTGWMPFLLPNQQHQSTEARAIMCFCTFKLICRVINIRKVLFHKSTSITALQSVFGCQQHTTHFTV